MIAQYLRTSNESGTLILIELNAKISDLPFLVTQN